VDVTAEEGKGKTLQQVVIPDRYIMGTHT